MHKGVKHKGMLSNCDECDYSCTNIEVLVMHKFRKHGGQDIPLKLCLTNGGLRFHKNAELESPDEFKCALCDYTALKHYTHRKHVKKSMVFLNILL